MLIEGTADVIQNDQKLKSMGDGRLLRGDRARLEDPAHRDGQDDLAGARARDQRPRLSRAARALAADPARRAAGARRARRAARASADLDSARGGAGATDCGHRRGPDRRGAARRPALVRLALDRRGRGLDAARGPGRGAARAAWHHRHPLERGGGGRRRARRDRRQAAGHRSAARRDRAADPARPDGPLDRGGDLDSGDRAPPRRRRSGRARDAEHPRGRARGDRGDLRRAPTQARST